MIPFLAQNSKQTNKRTNKAFNNIMDATINLQNRHDENYRLTLATAKSIVPLLRPNFKALVLRKYPVSDYVAHI
jgi:hypothetical protein